MRIALEGVVIAALALAGCGKPPTPPPPAEKLVTTYRVIGGVSMGGVGAAALGFWKPERFDGVATLGGPVDAPFFQRMSDQFLLGGFCTRQELEAILASDPVALNDPRIIDACSKRPTPMRWEHPSDFNHWHPTSNGGTFDRDSYIELTTDLGLGYGNLFSENPASPFVPPGTDIAHMRSPPADFCSNPLRVKKIYNREYNPEGKYDAITFCDGEPNTYYCKDTLEKVDFCSDHANVVSPLPRSQELAFAQTFCQAKGGWVQVSKGATPLYFLDHAGQVDPCRLPTTPVKGLLAVDYNGNGRRDYGEPVINNGQERSDDVGTDGCADAYEDGHGGCTTTAGTAVDPNHDNYDADTNPLGTEADWMWEAGEPYRDDGLDGVPNTQDVGEGNGVFDQSSGRKKLFALDPRSNFKKLDEKGRRRLNVFADGGIRDVFNLGLMARHLFAQVKALRTTPVAEFRDFLEIPGMVDRRTTPPSYNPWSPRWRTNMPHDVLMLFGKDNPTDADRVDGEGDHVGTPTQAVYRFTTMFNWAAGTWPTLERPATPYGGTTAEERQKVEWYQSAVLGAKWEYAIALPPGYDEPVNTDKRYPVVYMLHGYGMDASGFLATSLITDAYVTDTDVKFRPMIFVYASGRCCWLNAAGQRDCREKDDNGLKLRDQPGWERECNSGTFYVNRSGYTPNDHTAYGDAFFELMDHVDATYRTLPTAEVEQR